MSRCQKGKAMKRQRSWHQLRNQDRKFGRADKKLQRAIGFAGSAAHPRLPSTTEDGEHPQTHRGINTGGNSKMLIAPPTTRDIDGASVNRVGDRGTISILAIHNVVGGYQDDQSGYSCRGCRTVYPHAYDVTDDSYIELAADAAVTLAGRLLELAEPLTTNENEGHQHD